MKKALKSRKRHARNCRFDFAFSSVNSFERETRENPPFTQFRTKHHHRPPLEDSQTPNKLQPTSYPPTSRAEANPVTQPNTLSPPLPKTLRSQDLIPQLLINPNITQAPTLRRRTLPMPFKPLSCMIQMQHMPTRDTKRRKPRCPPHLCVTGLLGPVAARQADDF